MSRRLFLTADSVGGVWQYATELARALEPHGWDITVALLGPTPSKAHREMLDGTGVTLLDTRLPLDWLSPDAATVTETGLAVARLAREHRADVVQLNQPALAAGVSFGVPVVAVAHSCVGTWWQAVRGTEPEPASFGWQTALMQRGLANVDAVIAPSRAFAAALQARYALASLPNVIHNGRTPLRTRSRALHDFAFTAGRLWDEGKNIATLDRAAARLGIPFKAAGPVCGPNGERAALEHLHALGAVDEHVIAGCLSARPVFLSAARYEPFGLAVLEAALAGCPLILSDISTFRELWEGAAVFVDPDDSTGFANAIEELTGDVPQRLALGDLARRHAARFTPNRMAEDMNALFTDLLATAARKVAA
jgi:glycosyltransferase involved in cell wall biosynthesis